MKRMTLIGAVALGVTLVWACSSAVEDLILTPDASAGGTVSTSGERLQIRPIVYEGDDGSIIHMGEEIFDTELGVVCEPGLAADGVMRCLPVGPRIAHELLEFATSDCDPGSRSLSLVPSRCAYEYFVSIEHASECHSDASLRHRVYGIGEALDVVFTDNCESHIVQGAYPSHELIEIPASAFARLVRNRE